MNELVNIEWSKIPVDIVCNGFSLKDTIFNTIKAWANNDWPDDEQKHLYTDLAEKITEALAVKLHLKQGNQ